MATRLNCQALFARFDAGNKKKETKLGLSASKTVDFGEWYSQVVLESGMISYSDVSGMNPNDVAYSLYVGARLPVYASRRQSLQCILHVMVSAKDICS